MTTPRTDLDEAGVHRTEADAIAEVARESALNPIKLEGDRLVVFPQPDGKAPHVLDLEKYQAGPTRARGTTTVYDVDGFARALDSIAAGADDDRHATYADPDARTITAVLNDDTWRDWRIVHPLRLTREWQAWTAFEGFHPQVEFAEFIEDNLADIAAPEPTTMLEISRSFTATVATKFSTVARLDNGQVQLAYTEEIDGRAGGPGGQVVIPETFTIRVAPFVGSDPADIVCRLRYRINQGDLRIGYFLPDRERMADEAFAERVTEVTGLVNAQAPVFVGPAPSETRARS